MIEWCELVLPNAPLVPLPGGAPGDRTRAWFDSEALPPVERAVLGGAPFDPARHRDARGPRLARALRGLRARQGCASPPPPPPLPRTQWTRCVPHPVLIGLPPTLVPLDDFNAGNIHRLSVFSLQSCCAPEAPPPTVPTLL